MRGFFDWLVSPDGAIIVSAYATALGVLIALWLGLLAETRSRSDRQERTEVARRAQASQVAAWLEPTPGSRQVAKDHVPDSVDVVIHNGSPQPIYWVTVWSPKTNNGHAVGVVGPGTRRFSANEVSGLLEGSEKLWDLATVPLVLTFSDGAGVGWNRDNEGTLRATRAQSSAVKARRPRIWSGR